MKVMHDVPRSLAEVSPQWLSAALGAEVRAIVPQTTIHGTATKAVLQLEYAPGSDPALPRSVCVKGGLDEPHAEALARQGSYAIEGRYYRDVAPMLAITKPRVFAVAMDTAGYCVIVMEDLTAVGAHFLRATKDVLDVDEVTQLLDDLAALHARWWGGSPEIDWLDSGLVPDSPLGRYFLTFSQGAVAEQLERRGEGLRPKSRDAARIYDAYWRLERRSADPPVCVLHGDAHVGNTYRRPDGIVGLCDWQTMIWGRWSHDVAYLVGSSLDPSIRGGAEHRLLEHYTGTMRAKGIDIGSSADAWMEYREAMLYGFYGWLTNPLYFQPEEISAATARRFAIAIEELDSIDLLLSR